MPYVELTFTVPVDKDGVPQADGANLASEILAHAERLLQEAGCTVVVSRTT